MRRGEGKGGKGREGEGKEMAISPPLFGGSLRLWCPPLPPNPGYATDNGNIKTAQQRIVIPHYGDWYTGR